MAPRIVQNACAFCGACVVECPVDAIVEKTDSIEIIAEKCVDCYVCIDVCPVEAIVK